MKTAISILIISSYSLILFAILTPNVVKFNLPQSTLIISLITMIIIAICKIIDESG